ncbi:MAG: DEAD/DEAH box helicase [Chloroflexi bacterium]|nr:DEAD/DEAH box helicase [Chloroflexota bacterium]
MPTTYIALDLETTGLDSERDAIIEVGAVKFHDGASLDTFSTFVNPGRPIPRPITELTGIRDSDVITAPDIKFVLPRLARFIKDAPIIGHNVQFDLAFLRRANRTGSPLFGNLNIDTFDLAGVMMPEAERYSLGELAQTLGIKMDRAHRALDDAVATQQLFVALVQRAAALPPRLLQELAFHAERAGWGAVAFFRQALEMAGRQPTKRDGHSATTELSPAPLRPRKVRPLQPVAERSAVDVDELAGFLEGDGAFDRTFPHFEHRPQQVAMLRTVAHALNEQRHMLIEAPTGVGKSLAYLIPAVHWAVQNGERVVISTNTINLQEQLHRKDLPDVARVLPFDFNATVLKGRSHYLCPSRLETMRRRGVRTPEEARVLAKVLVWQLSSTDGDGDELFLPSPVEKAIWARLSAEYEGCDPERCRRFQTGDCYFYRARHDAESAHLVIVNHALLLADIAVQNRALPEYNFLIVDEAHHLENATTNGLSFEVDRVTMHRQLQEAGLVQVDGRVTGLIAEVLGACQQARLPAQITEQIEMFVGKIGIATARAIQQLDSFFDRLNEFVEEQKEGRSSQYAFRIRITQGLRAQPSWESIEIAWDDANVPLAAGIDGLQRLAGGLEDLAEAEIPNSEDLQAQLIGLSRRLAEAQGQLNQMITQPSRNRIYWMETRPGSNTITLFSAPLHVGPLVQEHLFHKKECVILTSATLRTNGTFDYVRERLSAWDADDLAVGSPFDYASSTLVYLVDDVPEPNQPGYQRTVDQGMTALFRATGGRALALFTSYNQLRTTYNAIRAPLERAGITVEAQGEGVSRQQLLENFRAGERRVLLGTRSFWEGVDVRGEALSCLAIAKLPFDVPSDPVFAARAETFDEPFFEYAVPETILRFLQGFGRLIRTRDDRGVVAVFDTRLITKSYGELFINSLPEPTVRRGPLTMLPKAAAEWLSGDNRLEHDPVQDREGPTSIPHYRASTRELSYEWES